MSKINIHLKIAGRSFPLAIEREDEERYRRAEREVNELVAHYKNNFRGDENDHLAMAALQIALEKVTLEMSRSLGAEMDALVELDRKLDNYMTSKAQ